MRGLQVKNNEKILFIIFRSVFTEMFTEHNELVKTCWNCEDCRPVKLELRDFLKTTTTTRCLTCKPTQRRSGEKPEHLREREKKKLVSDLKHNTGLLQQVRPHVSPSDAAIPIKSNLNVLPKATAVVIPGCLCISDRLVLKGIRHI